MKRLFKPAVVASVLAGGVAAWHLGLLDDVGPTILSERLLGWGAWGWLAVLGGWTLLQPFGVSGWIWLLAAAMTWEAPIAVSVTLLGSMLSAFVCFGFARFIARDWVATKVPARFLQYEDKLRRNGFGTITLARMLLFCSPPFSLAMGVSSVRFRDYMLGTLAGNLPVIIAGVLLGERVLDWFFAAPA